jgi:hypothetical protein
MIMFIDKELLTVGLAYYGAFDRLEKMQSPHLWQSINMLPDGDMLLTISTFAKC